MMYIITVNFIADIIVPSMRGARIIIPWNVYQFRNHPLTKSAVSTEDLGLKISI